MSNLKELRTQNCLTQKELADKVGIDVVTLSRIENGKQMPRPANKRSIALVLGTEPAAIEWIPEDHTDLNEPRKDITLEELFGVEGYLPHQPATPPDPDSPPP